MTSKQQWQGQDARFVRPAKLGDPGYDKNADQVVITLDSGKEQTVPRSEVTMFDDTPAQPASAAPNRFRPDDDA